MQGQVDSPALKCTKNNIKEFCDFQNWGLNALEILCGRE